MRKTLMAGVAAATLAVSSAQAALSPITTTPVATGPMTVVFVFQDAGDTSNLAWAQPPGGAQTVIVNNKTDPIGTTAANFGAAGPVGFILNNLTTGYSFTAGTADPVDGLQHFVSSNNFADFGVGPLSSAAASAVAAAGPGGIYVGVEDRRFGDYDYNDLIYYFKSVNVAVPAPGALALFGVGLLGLGAIRRKA